VSRERSIVSSILQSESLWIVSQLLTYLGFLLALVLLAHLLGQRRTPSSTIAWLLMILLLPYVGVPLYLMFGGRKIRRMAEKKEPVYASPALTGEERSEGVIERVLQSHGVPPASQGNRVEVVPQGEETFQQLIRIIDAAERSIYVTTYILGRDAVGAAVVAQLARAARKGLEVRLLLDDVGSWRVGRKFLAPLVESGARVAFFMPMIHLPFRGRANLRNHRKLVVVDGCLGMIGGMNLASVYMGPTPDPKRWRDLSLFLSGPVIPRLTELFRSDWNFATGEDLKEDPAIVPPGEPVGDSLVQVVASGPDVVGDPLYEALVSALFTAARRIWVVTPYFVPDEMLARALELAARRGVDLRLVVPARSNHLTADLARGSYLRQVHNAGGHVLLFKPGMVHAKVLLIDDRLAVIGSGNMDMRSLFLNYEVAMFLYSRSPIDATARWIESLMTECTTDFPVPSRGSELAENVVRLLSPLL
jgi:cardiolipin synthase